MLDGLKVLKERCLMTTGLRYIDCEQNGDTLKHLPGRALRPQALPLWCVYMYIDCEQDCERSKH